MTTTIRVRHRCDRCNAEVEREYDKDQPGMPTGWRLVSTGWEPQLLCPSCAEALVAWLSMKPEAKAH
jgi:hypothetical protein